MSRTFAYLRVSTLDQTTENQALEIETAGFAVEPHRVIAETVSGSVSAFQRKGFSRLLEKLESGDVLVVTKLDRLGRDAIDVAQTVGKLTELGVRVHCLALGGVDLTSAAGQMTMHVLNAVAQFERDLLIERTQAGLARAKAKGKKLGRPRQFQANAEAAILADLAAGKTVKEVARLHKTSRQTVMRIRDKDEQKSPPAAG